jgi:hypothetical protein
LDGGASSVGCTVSPCCPLGFILLNHNIGFVLLPNEKITRSVAIGCIAFVML